jgi:hypothetical protein
MFLLCRLPEEGHGARLTEGTAFARSELDAVPGQPVQFTITIVTISRYAEQVLEAEIGTTG